MKTTALETGVAYALQMEREHRLATLRAAYAAGNVEVLQAEAGALLAPYDYDETDRLKLLRRLIEVEIATRKAIAEEQAANVPSPPTELGDDQENPLLSIAARGWLEEKKSIAVTGQTRGGLPSGGRPLDRDHRRQADRELYEGRCAGVQGRFCARCPPTARRYARRGA